jgi:cell wall-associated NlpC family hydrolase
VNCRNTARYLRRPLFAICGAALVVSFGAAIPTAPAGATTTGSTSTSVPTQAQITATQAQVAGIEATIAHQQQETAALSQQFDAAQQQIQTVNAELAKTKAGLSADRAAVTADRAHLAAAAVNAYMLGTTATQISTVFTTGANASAARNEYETTAIGDISGEAKALTAQQAQLTAAQNDQITQQHEAQAAAAQAQALEQANQTATAAAQATLQQVKGTLAQEVAAAAEAKAQQEAAAAAAARSASAAKAAAAAAAQAANVAGAVGGASAGAAATVSANQAASSASGGSSSGSTPTSGGGGPTSTTINHVGPNGATNPGGNAAVQAAISQLGVPYVWGGEAPGVGFDCSGLTQWAWSKAGIYIPRTADSQYGATSHVPLTTLEPGDLLFYYNLDTDSTVDHVVMYVGSGPYGSQTIIQAPQTGETVSYHPLYTYGLIAAGRP